jgi:hypothetical protein
MSILRFALRANVSLELFKLCLYIADVVYGAGHNAMRLVLKCINGVNSNNSEGEQKFSTQKSISNTGGYKYNLKL